MHLHELRAAQVEHELRVVAHLRRQLERLRVILPVLAEPDRPGKEVSIA